jgi:predicted RNA binding protein YcfA (HicA-like mRNA interferase family)
MKAVSGRELARVLERKGWQLLRVRGSHFLYGRGTERIVIPVHGNETLKTGMQRDLMKQRSTNANEQRLGHWSCAPGPVRHLHRPHNTSHAGRCEHGPRDPDGCARHLGGVAGHVVPHAGASGLNSCN